ncbi:MAG: hypothetical protein HOC70_01125, partial [Gammaproteobacteria bacterium]|nr:hypothetical protein [Gammaproteobacteria bacterium]
MRLLSLVVATFLFCSPASAREVFLGEIIEAFRDSGYSLIYSTALVNESLPVEWQGDVSLISLREILKDQGLMLTRL